MAGCAVVHLNWSAEDFGQDSCSFFQLFAQFCLLCSVSTAQLFGRSIHKLFVTLAMIKKSNVQFFLFLQMG